MPRMTPAFLIIALFTMTSVALAHDTIIDPASVDDSVPHPSAIIGHAIGDGAVRHAAVVEYLQMLADQSPRVTLTPYADTHEGRTLYYATITSEANHRRLDAIRDSNATLADQRGVATPEVDRLISTLPGIAWMSYCIHGDEMSGTDAALLLAYYLAAGTDDLSSRMRDNLVVHIDPLMNADGRERYLNQLQTLHGKVDNPDYAAMHHSGLWAGGRGNHYLFDMNRDWVPQTQPETRGRSAALRTWNPHLLVDGHEMGALDTFLFDPPREPINSNLSPKNREWRQRVSADQAKAFDERGWSYYTQEWYEEWYPGYTNGWASLRGAIGILYEQASIDGQSITKASGEIETYHDAVHHQYVSSVANLTTLLENREAILNDYAADRRSAISDNTQAAYVIPASNDRSLLNQLADTLTAQGIEVDVATASFDAQNIRDWLGNSADTGTYPLGSLIIPLQQPNRRLLNAILEFDPRMTDAFIQWERSELEKRKGSLLYDVTAWNLPMAYGLPGVFAESLSNLGTERWQPTNDVPSGAITDDAAQGYIIDGSDSSVHAVVARLMAAGCRLRFAEKPFTLNGRTYRQGSILLRANENPATLSAILRTATEGSRVDITSTNAGLTSDGWDLGGRRFHLLHQPRVAIASQWPVSTTSFGAIWHDLDSRVGLRTSPINVQSLGGLDMRRYNVLILPSAGGLGRVMSNTQGVREWIEDGGTLITVASSTSFVAEEDRKLSQLRLRRDMLEKLEEYDEAVERERAAQGVEIDPAVVWGDPVEEEAVPPAESDAAETVETPEVVTPVEPTKLDKDAKKRLDEWQRMFAPAGVFVRTRVDTEHWITAGVDTAELPVLVSGSSVYLSKHPVQTPVRIADAEGIRLSGLLWPEARERLANSAYITVERVGNGQIITFAADPVFRSYHDGTARLLRNAVLYGPGMGTNQPVPW